MTLLFYDDVFLEHDTGSHPECRERLQATWKKLVDANLHERCDRVPWSLATDEQLSRVHHPVYLEIVRQFAEQGGGSIESDTVVSVLSHHVASQASGAVCKAVEEVTAGNHSNAFCLVRPPGHHALHAQAMGFCLFNHIAVGARHAIDALGLERVLIVDWDVHHGNGTQELFYDDGQVGFLSIHRRPFYPGTGDPQETGTGDGLGTTMNLAIEFGTNPNVFLNTFAAGLESITKTVQPELILISAGFDAHRADPIGSLGLEVEHFTELTRLVMATANEYCQGRIVSMLEGGYNVSALALCVESHLEQLVKEQPYS